MVFYLSNRKEAKTICKGILFWKWYKEIICILKENYLYNAHWAQVQCYSSEVLTITESKKQILKNQ